ncbi:MULTISPECIES: hypothetical protein [unclassified Streptomyces]|uniref:hypothetical protein n=1 Tax=unclassified Streptomyces TaxID=2593676 RepID=UPI002E2C3417|nr:hypothetical protein [Streptomyces sp. NBC_00223]
MRFMVSADSVPVTVQFEPSGAEYVVRAGDHLIVEWPDGPGGLLGGIDHSPDGLVISEPGNGLSRIWNSRGEELSILG